MLGLTLVLATMAALAPQGSSLSPGNMVEAPATKVTQSGLSTSVDCGGADLMVSGDHDTLTVSNCATINVIGNANRITAHLLPQSTIAALGNHNRIVFLHAPGFEAVVNSSGVGNEIVPDLSRDAGVSAPAAGPRS